MAGGNRREDPEARASEQTDIEAYAPIAARQDIADLDDLLAIAGQEDPGISAGRLEDLGLVLEGGDPPEDQANSLLDELPLAIETTVTFEIVLGTGGPDRRICLECEVELLDASEYGRFPDAEGFTVRRACYRYSWSGSAEVDLSGADRQVAEEFARRAIPELAR
jgi:hypothetical protein